MERKDLKTLVVNAAIAGAMIVIAIMDIARNIDRLREMVAENALPEATKIDTCSAEPQIEDVENVEG